MIARGVRGIFVILASMNNDQEVWEREKWRSRSGGVFANRVGLLNRRTLN